MSVERIWFAHTPDNLIDNRDRARLAIGYGGIVIITLLRADINFFADARQSSFFAERRDSSFDADTRASSFNADKRDSDFIPIKVKQNG